METLATETKAIHALLMSEYSNCIFMEPLYCDVGMDGSCKVFLICVINVRDNTLASNWFQPHSDNGAEDVTIKASCTELSRCEVAEPWRCEAWVPKIRRCKRMRAEVRRCKGIAKIRSRQGMIREV
jgi:hypothetical protein